MAGRFYVYEHLRIDNGAIFYVGKGSNARDSVTQHRNQFWRNVVAKAGGFASRRIAEGLDEELSHIVEVERIAQLRAMGVRLTNLTDGGEGVSGYVVPADVLERRAASQRGQKRPGVSEKLKGVPKSSEHRTALSVSSKGRVISLETRLKISASGKGRQSTMKGKRHKPESIEKIREAVSGEKNPFWGRSHSQHAIAKIIAANVGKVESEETRRKKSLAHSGERNRNYGKPVPLDRKEKQRASLLATIAENKSACEHCGKIADKSNLARWHGPNCRGKY